MMHVTQLQHKPLLSNLLAGVTALLASIIAYTGIEVIMRQIVGPQFTVWEQALQTQHLIYLHVIPAPAVLLTLVNVIIGVIYQLKGKAPAALHPAINRLSLTTAALLAFLVVFLLTLTGNSTFTALVAAATISLCSCPYFFLADAAFFPSRRTPRVKAPAARKRVKKSAPMRRHPLAEDTAPTLAAEEVQSDAEQETPAHTFVQISEDGKTALVRMGEDATIEHIVPVGPLREPIGAAIIPRGSLSPVEASEGAEAPTTPLEASEVAEEPTDMAAQLAAARRELRRSLQKSNLEGDSARDK